MNDSITSSKDIVKDDNEEITMVEIEQARLASNPSKFFSNLAYEQAIKNRGFSFIKAAKLIIENRFDSIHSSDLRKERNKEYLKIINNIEKQWNNASQQNSKSLDALIKLLCENINFVVYKNKKGIKELTSELSNAENHFNWSPDKTKKIENIVVLDDEYVQVRIEG